MLSNIDCSALPFVVNQIYVGCHSIKIKASLIHTQEDTNIINGMIRRNRPDWMHAHAHRKFHLCQYYVPFRCFWEEWKMATTQHVNEFSMFFSAFNKNSKNAYTRVNSHPPHFAYLPLIVSYCTSTISTISTHSHSVFCVKRKRLRRCSTNKSLNWEWIR